MKYQAKYHELGADMRMYFGRIYGAQFKDDYTILDISVDDGTPIRFGNCLIMELPKGMTKQQVLQVFAAVAKDWDAEEQK